MRQVIVFARFFLKRRAGSRKSDLMIGNRSDSGYDGESISLYEIFIVARSPRGIPARLMR
jgi:hypothetical protein